MSGIRQHLPSAAAILGLAALITWPLPASLARAPMGHPYGDMPDHLWGSWWFARTLADGRLPLTTDLSHYPEALSLWYVDPLGALAAAPLQLLGPIVAWNLLMLAQVLFALGAGYALGWSVTRTRAGGLIAAAAVGGSPYLLGLLHSGISEYWGLGWCALFVPALLRTMGLLEGRSRAWVTGALLAACGLQSFYYFAFGALLALCAVPGAAGLVGDWRSRARTSLTVLGVGGALIAPAVALTAYTLAGQDAAISSDSAPGWALAELPATDALTWLMPGDYYFPDTPASGNPGILHVNYLGWILLGLAGFGWWKTPALRATLRPTALYGLMALGPRLALGKRVLMVGGVSVLLPLSLLYFPGSPFRAIHQPYRMAAMLIPLLAIPAAAAAARLPKPAAALAGAVMLAEALLISPASWPLAVGALEPPPVYAALEAGPVLDWPPDASTWNRDYLLWQTEHQRPIPYGVNVFLPTALRETALVDKLLNALEAPDERARNRDVPFEGELFLEVDAEGADLAGLGFRYVVVHKAALSRLEWRRTWSLLVQALGDPITDSSEIAVWPTSSDLETGSPTGP